MLSSGYSKQLSANDIICSNHYRSGKNPRYGVYCHQHAKIMEPGKYCKYPKNTEHKGSQNGNYGREYRAPHSPQNGTTDFIAAWHPLQNHYMAHANQGGSNHSLVCCVQTNKEMLPESKQRCQNAMRPCFLP